MVTSIWFIIRVRALRGHINTPHCIQYGPISRPICDQIKRSQIKRSLLELVLWDNILGRRNKCRNVLHISNAQNWQGFSVGGFAIDRCLCDLKRVLRVLYGFSNTAKVTKSFRSLLAFWMESMESITATQVYNQFWSLKSKRLQYIYILLDSVTENHLDLLR